MVLIEAYIQFVAFMFFQQLKMPSFENFKDKINLAFAVIYMFFVFFFAFAGYALVSYFYKKQPKSFSYIYPGANQKSNSSYLMVIMTLSVRKLLLGYLQTLYHHFFLQMALLIALNIISLVVVCGKTEENTPLRKRMAKRSIYIIITLFLTANVFSKIEFLFSGQSYNEIQLILICLLCAICVIDFIFNVLSGIISACKAIANFLSGKKDSSKE